MDPRHRERLLAAGVEAEALDAQAWRLLTDELPQWWHDCRNALYYAPGAYLPDAAFENLLVYPMSDSIIVVGSPLDTLASLLVGGDRAVVFFGERVILTAGDLYCGPDSSIVLHGPLVATRCPVVDARNGGSVVAEPDQLWAAGVYIATDDMHRLTDVATGARLNPFGADIRLGRHVWLCRDAVVSGHTHIEHDAVVGTRSVVRGQKVPAHTVVAGTPARVVREGVTWDFDDLP
ncbi:MAG: hypothetical protein QM621_01910 [Aeromicrobium sp.]|uniref:acyltransferase n=1 Tax=Aeromicrobium sp. TaxID=1871063 RepID=UPI0039E21645